MEKMKSILRVVIVAMVITSLILPAVNNGHNVNAATKKVKVIYQVNDGKFQVKKYAKKKSYSKELKKNRKYVYPNDILRVASSSIVN